MFKKLENDIKEAKENNTLKVYHHLQDLLEIMKPNYKTKYELSNKTDEMNL